jgi:hypothetical protein
MDGQTQIPEALMGALLIEQGAQKGQFQPVTRDGQPTVAARLMQQATPQPMGVGQAMEQAGLAAQIQAMQAQQAQQAMMQQAMSQQRPQMLARGGLTSLNFDIDGFAPGGIVGYNGLEDSMVVEPAQASAGESEEPSDEATMESENLAAIRLAKEAAPRQVTPQQAAELLAKRTPAVRDYLTSQGIDPDFFKKAVEETTKRGQERAAYYEGLAGQARESQKANALRDFLLSARGRSFADVMGAGAGAVIAGERAAEAKANRLMEERFNVQDAAAKEARLLRQAEYQTATGDFVGAEKSLQAAETARQNRAMAEAKIRADFGKQLGISERFEQSDETRRLGQTMRLQGIRERLERAQSTGTAKGARVQRTITGPDGGVVLIMSDGTQVATGITSGEFNRTVARLITDMARRDPAFAELPEAEKRTKALERLTGSPTGVAPAPAPTAAPGGVARPTTQAQFDALPKGARYINPSDGKEYTKN